MHFWKNNKWIVSLVFLLPLFFIYIDRKVILLVRGFRADSVHFYALLHTVDPMMEFLAHGATLIAGAFMLYLIGRFFQPRLYDTGRTLFAGLVFAGVTSQALKHLIGRARPRLTDSSIFIGPSLKGGYDSFPSGHTTLAFCFAYILSQYFPRYRTPLYLFAFMVCLERVEDLAHFPSDVLAGALVGLMAGKVLLFKNACQEADRYAGEN